MTPARFVFVSADLQKGLGDWIMSLPAINLAREKWGAAADIVGICPSPVVELASWAKIFERVYPYRADWVEAYSNELEGATLLLALMDSDMRVYEDVSNRLRGKNIRTLVLRNRFWRERQHHARMVVRNLEVIGVECPDELDYHHPLTCWKLEHTSQRVAIHAGCGPLWQPGAKNWPYFHELGRMLQRLDYEVVQIVGPTDLEMPMPQFRGSVGELAAFLLTCRAFVGNDSGPAHLAGSLGVPTHVIFGFTDPDIWRPVGPRVKWVRAESKRIADVSVEEVFAGVSGSLDYYKEQVRRGWLDGVHSTAMGN